MNLHAALLTTLLFDPFGYVNWDKALIEMTGNRMCYSVAARMFRTRNASNNINYNDESDTLEVQFDADRKVQYVLTFHPHKDEILSVIPKNMTLVPLNTAFLTSSGRIVLLTTIITNWDIRNVKASCWLHFLDENRA